MPVKNHSPKNIAGIDPDVTKKSYEDWRDKPIAKITAEVDETFMLLCKITDAIGDNYDLNKSDDLGDGNLTDRATKLFQIHSHLSGIQKAQSEIGQIKNLADNIRMRNSGNGEVIHDGDIMNQGSRFPNELPQYSLFDEYEKALKKIGRARPAGPGIMSTEAHYVAEESTPDLQVAIRVPGRDILNTLFKQTAGWAPEPVVQRGYVPMRHRPVQITDIFPRYRTTSNGIEYYEQTTRTSGAVEIAEGAASPESQIEMTKRTFPIELISTNIPATDIQLADEDQARRMLEDQLPMFLLERLDSQLMNGNGTSPNIAGVLSKANLLSEDWDEAGGKLVKPINTIRKVRTRIRFEGRAMADYVVINQNIWDTIAMSESTAGGYYGGNPFTGFTEQAWGLPVVLTDLLSDAAGSDTVGCIVGAFRMWAALYIRQDLIVAYGYSGDDWLKHTTRLRAHIRGAMEITRPQAFAKIVRA